MNWEQHQTEIARAAFPDLYRCTVCGGPKARLERSTCNAPECRRAHRARQVSELRQARAAALIAQGLCPKCGAVSAPPTSIGVRILRCVHCLAKDRAYHRKIALAKKAARKRDAAVARLAAAAIERRRRQQAALDAGREPSWSQQYPNAIGAPKPPIRAVEL